MCDLLISVRRSPSYQLSNRSDDIRNLFCAALDRLDIPWRRMNRLEHLRRPAPAVAALDTFVEPKD